MTKEKQTGTYNSKTPSMFGWIQTPDLNFIEKRILSEVQIGIYERLKSIEDKFIVSYVFEGGNEKQDAARILGIKPISVYKRIQKIREILRPMVEKRIR